MSVFTEEPANITHTIVVMKYYWFFWFVLRDATSEICVVGGCVFACLFAFVRFFSKSKEEGV